MITKLDLKEIDKKEMYLVYDKWSEIAENTYEENWQSLKYQNIDHIVFAGMGGSGSIGDTIGSILSKEDIHVSNVKGYLLPKTVDSKTLVIATSVSGKTMETIQILKNVKNSSATAVGFSSGGMLEQYCKNQDIFFQKIPMIHSPRASFTSFLFSILNILEPILPIRQRDVKEAISMLKKTKENIFSENLTIKNKSLELAQFTNNITCIYHAAGLQASAVRYKNSLQENAKIHCMVEDVIESSHNGIVPWEMNSTVKPVLIQGKDDHDKTSLRWKILKEFFEMKKIDFKVIDSVEGNILSKITNLIYLLDYSTIYSAILNNIDPSPVSSIDFIKNKLEIQE